MKNIDEQVDRVLNGLRDVEVPVGMEHRVLRTAQEQTASPVPVRRSAGSWAWGGAFAGVAAVCVIALMLHRDRPATMAANLPGRAVPVTPQTDVTPSIFSPASIARSKPKTRHDSRGLRTDQSSSGELQASFPAPPMPLTEQEKLLLRVVHQGDPVQLAMLDPLQRSAQDARGRVEFQQFFEPSTTGENK